MRYLVLVQSSPGFRVLTWELARGAAGNTCPTVPGPGCLVCGPKTQRSATGTLVRDSEGRPCSQGKRWGPEQNHVVEERERKTVDPGPTCSKIHRVYPAGLSPAAGGGRFGAPRDTGQSQGG